MTKPAQVPLTHRLVDVSDGDRNQFVYELLRGDETLGTYTTYEALMEAKKKLIP